MSLESQIRGENRDWAQPGEKHILLVKQLICTKKYAFPPRLCPIFIASIRNAHLHPPALTWIWDVPPYCLLLVLLELSQQEVLSDLYISSYLKRSFSPSIWKPLLQGFRALTGGFNFG